MGSTWSLEDRAFSSSWKRERLDRSAIRGEDPACRLLDRFIVSPDQRVHNILDTHNDVLSTHLRTIYEETSSTYPLELNSGNLTKREQV